MSGSRESKSSGSGSLYGALGMLMVCALMFFAFVSTSTTEYRGCGGRAAPPAPAPAAPLQCPTVPLVIEENKKVNSVAAAVVGGPVAAAVAPVSNSHDIYFLMQCGGGLSNQRGGMLQELVLAKNWGIKKMILSPAILKLSNIQIELRKKHRYRPPYDYIKLRRSWTSPMYDGDFGELFDLELLTKVAGAMGIELIPRSVDFSNKSPVRFAAQVVMNVEPPKTWDEVLNMSVATTLGVPNPDGTRQPIMVATNMHYRLMLSIRDCRQLPHCMEMAKGFGPPQLVVKTFIEPILEKLGASYLAVHYRAFDCAKSAEGVAKVGPMIERLVQEGRLKEKPKIIYLATSMGKEDFHLLEQQNYTVLSKQSVDPTFNVVDYPFEIMAHVDFEVCRRAKEFVTMTDHKTSTFAIFLELHRELDGMSPVVFSGHNCR